MLSVESFIIFSLFTWVLQEQQNPKVKKLVTDMQLKTTAIEAMLQLKKKRFSFSCLAYTTLKFSYSFQFVPNCDETIFFPRFFFSPSLQDM
jgi:hypothetical protein